MIEVILGVDIWSFLSWIVFHSFISVALSTSKESVIAVGCLVENASEGLPGVATEGPRRTCF